MLEQAHDQALILLKKKKKPKKIKLEEKDQFVEDVSKKVKQVLKRKSTRNLDSRVFSEGRKII